MNAVPNKKYLVTSALPYANGELHLGHLAGAYLPADIYVRYLRGRGREVVWVCGSDEHGAAITLRAKKEGISPKEIIDKYHNLNKATFERLGISFDFYHRTSAELHHETAREFFTNLFEQGDQFEERTGEQYYDEKFNQFLADRYIKGTCPKCGYEEAFGDQCENCGSDLSPTELIDPVSTLSGERPVLRETTHWYFKLDQHADWLRDYIENGIVDGKEHHTPRRWKNHVVGQTTSWLNDLQARAITRDLDWGIPVPLSGADGKVLYVWFDAPIGYISATRAWAEANGKNWEDYWKGGEDVRLVHFIGKDNIVFHCIIFPAMLKAHTEYNVLPRNVPANQFLNFEGKKFSKSRGWGIEMHEYLDEFADFPNREDALRYAITKILPENRDADFTWTDFTEAHDKDLADNLGNFLNRVLVLTNKYFDGVTPELPAQVVAGTLDYPGDLQQLAASYCKSIEEFRLKDAAQTVMEISSWGNTFLQEVSPWKLVKEDPNHPKIAACMAVVLQTATLLSALLEPFVPFTAGRIRHLLNLPELKTGDLEILLELLGQEAALLPAGHRVGESEILFAKINDRKDDSRRQIVDRQRAKLEAVLAAEVADRRDPIKPTIQFDDFAKLDLRTGTIIAAERVKKADKLLKLTVNLHSEQRTVLSGIAQQFQPENLIGQHVVLVANLAPRKMRGIESQGMILMAEDAEGKLAFVSPGELGDGFTVR